jgi:hypothetical protein
MDTTTILEKVQAKLNKAESISDVPLSIKEAKNIVESNDFFGELTVWEYTEYESIQDSLAPNERKCFVYLKEYDSPILSFIVKDEEGVQEIISGEMLGYDLNVSRASFYSSLYKVEQDIAHMFKMKNFKDETKRKLFLLFLATERIANLNPSIDYGFSTDYELHNIINMDKKVFIFSEIIKFSKGKWDKVFKLLKKHYYIEEIMITIDYPFEMAINVLGEPRDSGIGENVHQFPEYKNYRDPFSSYYDEMESCMFNDYYGKKEKRYNTFVGRVERVIKKIFARKKVTYEGMLVSYFPCEGCVHDLRNKNELYHMTTIYRI